jgi:hypothetical protein
MPPKTSFPIFVSTSPTRIAFLQGLLIAAIVVTALYVGREVLVPLALAILLSFVLTPPLLFLRRLRVPRVLGIAILPRFRSRLDGHFTLASCRRVRDPDGTFGLGSAR